MIRKLEDAFVAICRVGTGVGFAVLIGSVLVQVVGRSILNASPPWTEELTRFAMLWMVAFGTGLSLRSGDLVNVDLFCEAMPGRGPWMLRLVSAALVTAFCAVLLYPAWFYASIGARQTSPVLRLPMDWIYVSILVLLAVLMLFALLRVVSMLAGQSDGLPRLNPEKQE
ncbi:TRAP transporter small permease [Mangrovibrevibacter kandeliae]|uniref:TRAP transporter small permease n=1 Tax=Mangrovibrevibacter kandeliae TaxID=2968473 RepID=UPI002117300F|nr:MULTISPECIES: TRAP transporter small permease [unclassified Aurantimonas]MCQ8781527.1 TRAP transporter small permease [Aurantimonas sp. CSK15Z-1]MCW4114303.1 TRAP transporter small permease [Aurantimonas sp. MSK8Z-1]